MTEAETKRKIKEIIDEPILKGIFIDGEETICTFCGWKPKYNFHPQASLLTHLSYNHRGQYKTKVDKLYDFMKENKI